MKKLLNILKSLGIIMLMILFTSLFFSIFNINPNSLTDKEYIIYVTLSNIILIGIYILIYRRTLAHDIKDFIKNFKKYFTTSLKYWAIGLLVMYISNIIITFVLNKELAGNEQEVRNYIDNFPLYMLFSTVIFAPITEELTFRKSIKDAISNKWIYIIISGLVFAMLHIIAYIDINWLDLIYLIKNMLHLNIQQALVHLNNILISLSTLVYLIPYGSLGIAFALLYHKTDNIYCPMSMHAMHNLIAVILYLLGASL